MRRNSRSLVLRLTNAAELQVAWTSFCCCFFLGRSAGTPGVHLAAASIGQCAGTPGRQPCSFFFRNNASVLQIACALLTNAGTPGQLGFICFSSSVLQIEGLLLFFLLTNAPELQVAWTLFLVGAGTPGRLVELLLTCYLIVNRLRFSSILRLTVSGLVTG